MWSNKELELIGKTLFGVKTVDELELTDDELEIIRKNGTTYKNLKRNIFHSHIRSRQLWLQRPMDGFNFHKWAKEIGECIQFTDNTKVSVGLKLYVVQL